MLKSDCGSIGLPFHVRFKSVGAITASAALAFFGVLAGFASGQQAGALARTTPQSGYILPPDPLGLGNRKLVEGVLTVVPPDQNAEDTAIGPLDLDLVAKHPELEWAPPEFEKGQPNFASKSETLMEMSRNVTLRHAVWGFEFSFKPARVIEVDYPTPGGKLRRKLVWYMIYRVRYLGGDLEPSLSQTEDLVGIPNSPKEVRFKSVRFIPRFTLTNTQTKKEYDSQVISTAIPPIALRERIGKELYDSFAISQLDIKPTSGDEDNSVWGVATWMDIDPTTNFFTVQVKGLTNAYRLKEDTKGNKIYQRKTLQIQFWRPGDSIAQTEDRVRLGVPAFIDPEQQKYVLDQFKVEKRLDYQWIYR